MFAGWKRHGNTKRSLSALVGMALIWAWGPDEGLQQRFRCGLAILAQWPRVRQWGLTYQGFLKILQTWSGRLIPAPSQRLRERMRELPSDQERVCGPVLMAVDGTRLETPRTQPNEVWFTRVPTHRRRAAKSSRARTSARRKLSQPAGPQIWLTVLWHMGWGRLWDWRQGPNGSSERAHLREMLDGLPEKTLLVADAGFQGYDYWRALWERGHSLLIRVAGQVRLLQGLGFVRRRANIVYLWPDENRRRHQPPLVLRLREFHDGRQSLWLVTNLLDEQELSPQQMAEIYRRRWGVEVFFRTFKQTFGRHKLRSHAPRNVELELDWSLLALWSLELWAAHELLARNQSARQRSTAGALRALRQCLQLAALGLDFPLRDRLAPLHCDGYDRHRKSVRRWPRKKQPDQIGAPQIREATLEQLHAARQLRSHAA